MEFTKHFLAQANQAFSTLDESKVERLSLPTCKTCAAMASQIRAYKAAKQQFMGEFAHPAFIALNKFEGSTAQVLVQNASPGGKVLDDAGRLVKQLPADRGKVIISLNSQTAGWRVLGIQSVT